MASDIDLILEQARRLSETAESLAPKPTREARAQAAPYGSRIPSATPAVQELREAQELIASGRAVRPREDRYEEPFQAVLADVREGPFGGEYERTLARGYDIATRPSSEYGEPLTDASTVSEFIAERYPGRPEGSLANVGTEFVLGALEPGPAELSALAEGLSMLAPRGLIKMLKSGSRNIEFMDPDILSRAPGNPLRRNPEEMEQFVQELMNDPDGLMEPVIVFADPDRGTYFVGEGNHRVEAARRLGMPIPVRVVRSSSSRPMERYMPEEAQQALLGFDPYGYIPSDLTPSEIGLPTIPRHEIESIVRGRVKIGKIDATTEELNELSELLSTPPNYLVGPPQRE